MARGPSNGFRAKTGRMWEMMPKPGRIAMYTSGCPKNQKRCCHRSGDPPEGRKRTVGIKYPPAPGSPLRFGGRSFDAIHRRAAAKYSGALPGFHLMLQPML